MRRLLMIASAAAITLAAVPAGFARDLPPVVQACPPGDTHCPAPPAKGETPREKADRPEGKPGKPEAHRPAQMGATDQHPGKGPKPPGRDQVGAREHADAKPPRIGASGKAGRAFARSENSRFKASPRGQDYRVVNDHLVLVDRDSLQIVTVLGLLSSLLN